MEFQHQESHIVKKMTFTYFLRELFAFYGYKGTLFITTVRLDGNKSSFFLVSILFELLLFCNGEII